MRNESEVRSLFPNATVDGHRSPNSREMASGWAEVVRRELYPAIAFTVTLTIATGVLFPLLIWAIGQPLFPYQANGSIVSVDGKKIGSEIIGQVFTSPRYFHPRPSAAGSGYDPLATSGTNLGPTSKKLYEGILDDPATPDVDESYKGVATLTKEYREENELKPDALLPVDAVTRSSSGLDPHISPRNAELQSARIARERRMKEEQVFALISKFTETRFLGIFGEPRVNVLKLNLALDGKEIQEL